MSPETKLGPKPGWAGNRLLDRLPEEEYTRLAPLLVSAPLKLKQLLIQIDEPIRDIYFPTTALVSTLVVMEDGSEIETGITGAEGVVGLSTALGLDFDLHRAICQVPGEGFRLPARAFREAVERSRPLDLLIRRYAAVVLRQTGQAVACNALHPVTERLSRWLLMTRDRVGRDEFPMTQEFMGELLGVRRQTVTVAAGTLQAAGLITFRRGIIRILDRPLLEEAACECYGLMRGLYDRVFP
jgi:CRP-like cAMP-binding protein